MALAKNDNNTTESIAYFGEDTNNNLKSSLFTEVNSPTLLINKEGKFPITPEFKANYPFLTDFIETRLEKYIQNSPRILAALLKYSTGNLTPEQIKSDFEPNNGPIIKPNTFDNPNHHAEYDDNKKTIKLSDAMLKKYEQVLANPDTKPETKKYVEMQFTSTFLNEYTHYGDALDGFDAVLDASGNVVNGPVDPCFGDCDFDEGNKAVDELFPLPTGRQNYYMYKEGKYIDPQSNKVLEINEKLIDRTMIPPDK